MIRYWVGGSGNWQDTAHWSTSSGGSSGASVPTSSDDVVIDSNSGLSGGTITLNGTYGTCVCHDFTSISGHNYTINYSTSDFSIFGSAVFEAGLTWGSGTWTYFYSESAETIESNGCDLTYFYLIGGGTFTLLDDLVTIDYQQDNGTFDANDFDVTARTFNFDADNIQVYVIMGNGTWNVDCTVTGQWYFLEVGTGLVNITPEGSTIKSINTSSNSLFFYGGNKTYNKIWITGPAGSHEIDDDNTFDEIQIDDDVDSLFLYPGTVNTTRLFTASGDMSNTIVIASTESTNFYNGSRDTNVSIYGGATSQAGESFTGDGRELRNIRVNLRRVGSPTGNAVVKVYAHSGTYGTSSIGTGSPLATSDNLDVSTITNANNTTNYVIPFSGANRITLVQGTYYVFVIEFTGGDASNYVRTFLDNTSPSYSGNYAYYNGSWNAVSGTDLAVFSIRTKNQATLVKTNGGYVSSDYLSLEDVHASPDDTWFAGDNSVDVDNTDGWLFEVPIEPTILSGSASNILSTEATLSGDIDDLGNIVVNKRGVVYGPVSVPSPSGHPSLSGYQDYVEEEGSFSTGVFSFNIENLLPNTTYYARAFVGNDYYYGDEISFTTSADGFSIFINSINRTNKVLYETFRISDYINQEVNQATFSCRSFKPSLNEEVEVYYEGIKIFGGVIVRIDTDIQGVSRFYNITCKDYSQYLNRMLVNERFVGETVTDIIQSLITDYAPDFTMDNVEGSTVIGSIVFNRISVGEAIQALAEAIDYSWYVDYDKDIHFFAMNDELAPFNLSDDGGNHVWDSLRITEDFSQIRNQIYIIGGEYQGEEKTESYVADGEQRQFPLAYKFSEVPVVEVNASPLTVGVDGLDTEDSFDVMWSFQQKYIRFKESNYPDPADVVAVTGTPLYPIIVKVPDTTSISLYGKYEFKIVDKNIASREDAIERGRVELEAYANSIEEGSFETYEFGLKSGQTITINVGDTNEDFIIQSVDMSMRTPNEARWVVRVATVRTLGIIQFLQGLLKSDEEIIDSEVLLELQSYSDSIEMDDTLTLPSHTQTGPYLWADATDPADEGRWNFATWT